MKICYKAGICLLSVFLMICLFGCSNNAQANEEIIGGADEETNIIVSDNDEKTTEIQTTVGNLGKSISFALTEEDAKSAAYDTLKQECENGRYSNLDSFELDSIALYGSDEGCIAYNRGYGNTDKTENFTGHSYYCVTYKETTQLCDYAYICIDAINGDTLFSGYMGD